MNFVSKQNCIWFFATWVTCYCKEHFLKNFWRKLILLTGNIHKRSCLQSKAKGNIIILFTLCLNHSDYVDRPIVTKTNIHWGINLIFYNISVFLTQMSDVPLSRKTVVHSNISSFCKVILRGKPLCLVSNIIPENHNVFYLKWWLQVKKRRSSYPYLLPIHNSKISLETKTEINKWWCFAFWKPKSVKRYSNW